MSRAGRPKEVEGGQICSILLGKKELRILAKAEQDQLAHRDASSRSAVIRQMVRSAWANHRDDLQELWKKDMEVAELRRRLEQAEKEKARLAEEAQAARNKVRAKETVMQRLLRHLPLVRQKAASGIELPSGITLLDQIWHNSGSWGRVLARLEEAQRELGGPP